MCQVKTFDGLGPFSYVCRMIRFSEPIPKILNREFLMIQLLKNMLREINTMSHVVNPERVRGFPLRSILKKGKTILKG